jgi:serine protease Do
MKVQTHAVLFAAVILRIASAAHPHYARNMGGQIAVSSHLAESIMSIPKIVVLLPILLVAVAVAAWPRPVVAQTGTSAPIDSLLQAHQAVVEIVSIGAALPYEQAEATVEVGSGSGFIVDPTGIVVTNAHVVNGGNLFYVYLSGDSEPYNAVLLGVSECNDLAVLDIRGDGFPYLAWQETPVLRAQQVTAAGFPEGRYAETHGRVRETGRKADTDWASVDRIVRHSAELHPGNSGGPLLNTSGEVVAVNYSSSDRSNSYFAIPNEIAVPLVAQLAQGQDVDSIGINGVAFQDSEDWSGIWVVAVESGSPSDLAGLKPGDILYEMEGIQLGYDGTMGTYCDIVRSHRPGDAIAFAILREGEYYAGQINGRALVTDAAVEDERALALDTEAAAQVASLASTASSSRDNQGLVPPDGYRLVKNDTGAIQLFVPATWDNESNTKLMYGSAIYGSNYIVTDASDTRSFLDNAGAMVDITFLGEDSPDDELDNLRLDETCTFARRQDVRTEDFAGRVDLWHTCGGVAEHTAATAAIKPYWDEETTVRIVVTHFEELASLETALIPLGTALRQNPVYWDIPETTIRADILNVRSGPSQEHEKRGQLVLDDIVTVLGKDSPACEWLYIESMDVSGWISANTEYSTLDRDCATLEAVTEDALEFSLK